ncbi:hypothetical protein TWF718_005210 [Orbilia javanica]|uniref:Uncharacterized protein n=1 Tax=Orbilia javanica TaxID=47235 RepID=A0AAN8RG48_9PEZI
MPDTDLDAEKGAWKSGEVGAKIGEIARKVWDALIGFEERKAAFPRYLVGHLMKEFPGMNVAVFHNQNSKYYFINGNHCHYEVSGPIGTFGYEAWVFECGYLRRYGDAGWENWTVGGKFYRKGEEVVFGTQWPKKEPEPDLLAHDTGKVVDPTVNIWTPPPKPEIYYETSPEVLYNVIDGKSEEHMRAHLNHNAQRWRPDGWWDSHPYGTTEGGELGTIKYNDSKERELGDEEKREAEEEAEFLKMVMGGLPDFSAIGTTA